MKIKNFKKISVSPLRDKALKIVNEGIESIDTKEVIKKNIKIGNNVLFVKNKRFVLGKNSRLFVLTIGKAALDSASALQKTLKNRIFSGISFDTRSGIVSKKIKSYKGSHPVPSQKNARISKKIIEFLNALRKEDVIITAISGGGSSLLSLPANGRVSSEIELFKKLTEQGANIKELNTVRKHTSLVRGGYIAKYAYPAKVISLIFSDVPGDDMQFIASGPTVRDKTTSKDAEGILNKYKLSYLVKSKKIILLETPKEPKYFKNVYNTIIVSNKTSLKAMAQKSRELGLTPKIVKTNFSGEAKKLGEKIANDIKNSRYNTALLYGGESTVKIVGNGTGGRNMELALSALKFISKNEIIIPFASDGRDNTEYAGGICDIITLNKAKNLDINIKEYLDNNNSYMFFKRVGDYILTGSTGSNVSDLVVAIKENGQRK